MFSFCSSFDIHLAHLRQGGIQGRAVASNLLRMQVGEAGPVVTKFRFYIFSDGSFYCNSLIIKYLKACYVGYRHNCFLKNRMKIDLVTKEILGMICVTTVPIYPTDARGSVVTEVESIVTWVSP